MISSASHAGQVTWWLYYSGDPIYSVRGPQDADAHLIRFLAMDWHHRVPLCYPEAPYSFARKLSVSEVRR